MEETLHGFVIVAEDASMMDVLYDIGNGDFYTTREEAEEKWQEYYDNFIGEDMTEEEFYENFVIVEFNNTLTF